jgi:hypothetical protein
MRVARWASGIRVAEGYSLNTGAWRLQRLQQLVGPLLLIGLLLAVYSHFQRPSASARPEGPPGWDDLILCSELTSIDSKKSLSLNSDFSAELTDSSATSGSKSSKGHWSLLNAEKHVYRIDTPGAQGNYIVVSPPDAEGCILAHGGITNVDLLHSWFSVQIEPADPQNPP